MMKTVFLISALVTTMIQQGSGGRASTGICGPLPTVEKAMTQYDAVFRGTVVSVDTNQIPNIVDPISAEDLGSEARSIVFVRADAFWKGEVHRWLLLYSPSMNFRVGSRYFFLARQSSSKNFFSDSPVLMVSTVCGSTHQEQTDDPWARDFHLALASHSVTIWSEQDRNWLVVNVQRSR